MPRITVKLDHAAIARMLKVQFAPAVTELAERVAATARENLDNAGHGLVDDDVRTYATDRAHSVVAIAHPAGKRIEAKYGILAKAAAEHGLEVRE